MNNDDLKANEVTVSIYETPCQIFSLKNCPFGYEDCEDCKEFLDELL